MLATSAEAPKLYLPKQPFAHSPNFVSPILPAIHGN